MIPRWKVRGWLFRALSLGPRPHWLVALARIVVDAEDAEDFADPRINGELDALPELLRGASVVFDVGANRGDWSRAALAAAPGTTIHAFEPSAVHLGALRTPGVTVHPYGLAAEACSRELFSTGSVFRDRETHSESARFDTLDAVCARDGIDRIDFLKMDVEGMELEVLRGSARMLAARRIAKIQFEYSKFTLHAGVRLRDLFELLEPLGYAIFLIRPRKLVRTAWKAELENFRYKNFVAILGDHA